MLKVLMSKYCGGSVGFVRFSSVSVAFRRMRFERELRNVN